MVAARDGRVVAEDRTALRLLDAATGQGLAAWPQWHLLPALRPDHGPALALFL